MPKTTRQLEVEDLRTLTGTSYNHLSQLKRIFYQAQTDLTNDSLTDLERDFLQQRTGSSNHYLRDLWDIYLTQEGYTVGTIEDRKRAFFTATDFEGSLLLETGDNILLETEFHILMEA